MLALAALVASVSCRAASGTPGAAPPVDRELPGEQVQLRDGTPDQQQTAGIAGYYEGHATSPAIGEVEISANLRPDRNAWSGTLHTPFGDFPLSADTLPSGGIHMRFVAGDGEPGSLDGDFRDGTIVGSFRMAGDSGRVDLQRQGPPREVDATRVGVSLDIAPDAWQDDLDVLVRELTRRHGNAFHTTPATVFGDSAAALRRTIPTLPPHAIVAGMARLVAMVGDGHTYLEIPAEFREYPVRLRWFGDTLRVIAAAQELSGILGARVVAIDGTTLREADRRIRAQVAGAENEQYVRSVTPWFLTIAELLHANGVTTSPDSATWQFESDEGVRRTVLHAGGANRSSWTSVRQEVPLALSRPGVELWYEPVPARDALYVNFSGYPGRTAFGEFFGEVFRVVDRERPRRLIIDLRENRGGDFTKARDLLLPHLDGHPINQPDRLFVLIGRNTFSAAMTTAADFRNRTAATLVGEPTGANPNGWQEKGSFRLPRSGLTISISTRYYRFMEEEVDAVEPHVRVEVSFADFREGRDPVLERALSFFR